MQIKSRALLDSGSTYCLISKDCLPEEILNMMQPTQMSLNGIACNPVKALGKFNFTVTIAGLQIPDIDFYVLPTQCPTLIGQTLIRHQAVKDLCLNSNDSTATLTLHDGNSGTTKCYPKPDKLSWRSQPSSNSCHDENSATSQNELRIPQFSSVQEKLEWVKSKMKLNIEWPDLDQASQFADLCIEYRAAFGYGPTLGKFPRKVRIPTTGESRARSQHNIPHAHRKFVDAEIETMLKADVIEECPDNKGFKTPIFLVGKKDGSYRPVMNFKDTLNKVLKDPDPYPMPSIDQIFAAIKPGNKFFSSFDLAKGYWQIEIHEDDRHKTSFYWNGKNYQFKRLPFGMTSSGNTFSRELMEVLKGCNFSADNVQVYLDDITVFATNFEDFMKNQKLLFQAVVNNGLKLKPEKCLVLKKEVPFLGRIITSEGMKPDPRHVQAFKDILPPRTWKQLQSLCGQLVWLSDFLATKVYEPVKSTSFAKLMTPIYDILRGKSKGKKFQWTPEADKCLNRLKVRLTQQPFIQFANPELPFTLTTDASDEGAAGVLMQLQDNKFKIIAAVSTTFNATQRNWSATEKEAYAVLWSCERLSHFLLGVPFTIFTDHKSLLFLDKRTFGNAKVANWQQKLSRYQFCVQYIQGKQNVLADWLSRRGNDVKKPVEDPRPAGKFLSLKGTSLRVYIPSWCNSEEIEPHGYFADFIGSEEKASFSAVSAFLCSKNFDPNPQQIQSLEIATQQRQDSFFGPIIKALIQNSHHDQPKISIGDVMDRRDSRYSFYKKHENEFQLDTPTQVLFIRQKGVNRIVVPPNHRKYILHAAHDLFGHAGHDRMVRNLRTFIWEGMHDDITLYLASCESCVRRKGRYGHRPLQQGHNLRGHKPFDVLYVDFIQMPTARGLKYCLTVMDSFSKYGEAFPSSHDRAIDAARGLSRFITRHGVAPKIISSDRGRHFISSVFVETCKQLGVATKLHVAYNPQSCAVLERWHRTLKSALFIVSKERNCLWPDVLDYTVQALNANFNAATKTSPFYCVFGRHYNIALPTLSAEEVANNPLSHGMQVNATLQMAHKFVRLCNKEADIAQDNRIKNNVKSLLQVGDKVSLYRPNSVQNDSKLPWVGNYVIVEADDYVAKISDGNGFFDWVHLNQLRKLQIREPDLILDSDDDSTPVIHAIPFKPQSEGAVSSKVSHQPSEKVALQPSRKVALRPASKVAPKVAPKPKKIREVEPPPRRSSRQSKPVNKLNINNTKAKSYAAVVKSDILPVPCP